MRPWLAATHSGARCSHAPLCIVRKIPKSDIAIVANIIVGFITLLMAVFVAVWLFFPHLRRWIEEPKYRFLEQQRRFPEVAHGESHSLAEKPG